MIKAVFDANLLVSAFLSRDHDLLSLGSYAGITIIAPEQFLRLVRAQ